MIFKKRNEDHTLLNPLHSSLTSTKNDDQPTNQLATIMINHVFSSTSGSANSTKRVAFPKVSSTTDNKDMPSIVEEAREEEAEKRDDNIEFSRETSYNANTERDNVEIKRQPTKSNGLDHLSYNKTLWHESPDSIEIPNIQRSMSSIVPASSLANYSLEARSKLQRIQSVNVEKVELGLLNEQIGCLAVDNDGNDYGDVTMLPSLNKKSTVTSTTATGLKEKKRTTHTAGASSNGTMLKHMFIKKKRYATKKDTQKKNVSRSSKTSVSSRRSMPLISESPLGFEVGGDGLSNVKPVDKQKANNKKTIEKKVSVDIRESPLGFELVGDGSDVKDTKKTAAKISPSSKSKKNTLVGMKKKKMRASRSSTKATKTKQVSPLVVAEDFFIAEPVDEPLKSPKVLRESPLGFEVEDSTHGTKKGHQEKKKKKGQTTTVTPLITKKEEPTHDIQMNVAKSTNKRLLAKLRESPLGFEVEEGSTTSIDMSEKEKEQVTPPLSSSSLTPPSAITDRKVSFVDNLASRAITDIMASETLAERSKYQSFGLWGSEEKERKSQTLLLDEGMIVPQDILDSLVEETDEEDSYVSSTMKGGEKDLSEEETLVDDSMLSGESTLLPKEEEESTVDDTVRSGYKLQFDLPKMEKKTSRLRLNPVVRLQSLNRMRTRSLRRIATEQGLLRFKASEDDDDLPSIKVNDDEASIEVTLDTDDEIKHDDSKDKRRNNNKKNSKRSKKDKKKSSRKKRNSKSRLNNQDDNSVDLLNEVERFLDQSGNVLADWGDKLLGFSSEEETLESYDSEKDDASKLHLISFTKW